ncbi:MAG: hypothetical protein ISS50_01405 [Anaerolineae bacterium]|nr:hypothetical protein [Anaerolineae bacterium]
MRHAVKRSYYTERVTVCLSKRDRESLVLFAEAEGVSMAAVVRRLIRLEAHRRGLWPPTADQHAQAQASKARGLELFAEKLPPTNNPQELIQAMEKLALCVDTVDGLNSLQTLRVLAMGCDEEELGEEKIKTLSMVENLIRSYHKQALDQAKVQFWVSVAGAMIGFLWIIYSAIGIDLAHIGTILKVLPGVVMDTAAFLFFQQARETRQRATELYDRLRSDSERSQAVALVESIEDERVRSVVKAQISLHMAGLQPSPIDLSAFLSYHTEGDS